VRDANRRRSGIAMWEEGKHSDQDAAAFRGRPNGADHTGMVHRNNGHSPSGTVMEHAPLFSGISPGDSARLSATARAKQFARGETLHIKGDPVRSVVLLTSGVVKTTQLGLSGIEVITRLVVTGEVLGAHGLFSTGKHCATAQTFQLCQGLVWDASVFKSQVDRLPVVHQNLVRILDRELLELEERFREVATERVGRRVARQLARLRDSIGRPVNGGIEVALSREDLAQMTGTTLFTVSRLLSAWEARGVVAARREAVTIIDIHALRAISEES